MTITDPMPLGRPTAGWRAMINRDPMLALAVAAHAKEWRPDLTPHLRCAMDETRRLPEVSVRNAEHQIVWPTPTGSVRTQQEFLSDPRRGAAHWHATATLPDGWPDVVVVAMAGRGLEEIVDLPGADAWRIARSERVPGIQVTLVLERKEKSS